MRRPPSSTLFPYTTLFRSQTLLADAVALEQPRDDREDLARLDRLYQVIVHLDPDRFAQRAFVLALGDHHHRYARVDRADLADQLEPAPPGHLLVEQHDAVGLTPQQREGVVAVRRRCNGEPLGFEKATVGGEPLHFVVHPQNGLRPRHRPKLWRLANPGNAGLIWQRAVRPARPVQLHRRHPAHHAARARARPPPPRGEARVRDEARDGAAGRRQPPRGGSRGARAGRAAPPPGPAAAGPGADAWARPARQRPQRRAPPAGTLPLVRVPQAQAGPHA